MRLLQWLPVALWSGLILVSANDHLSANQTGGWLSTLFGGAVPYVLHVVIRKAGHVVAYGILAALAWRADRRWFVVIAVALLVAATDEWMQSRTAMRSGSPWDVLLDVTSAAGVWWLCHRFSSAESAPPAR